MSALGHQQCLATSSQACCKTNHLPSFRALCDMHYYYSKLNSCFTCVFHDYFSKPFCLRGSSFAILVFLYIRAQPPQSSLYKGVIHDRVLYIQEHVQITEGLNCHAKLNKSYRCNAWSKLLRRNWVQFLLLYQPLGQPIQVLQE